MGYALSVLRTAGGREIVSCEELRERVEKLLRFDGVRLRRLWAYYRNPMRPAAVEGLEAGAERPYRQAQEWGMPARITGMRSGAEVATAEAVEGAGRKEVVVENDIGWRIDTMVDYLFGKPVVVRSAAPDPGRRAAIDRLVRAIIAHNGGLLFLQQLALIGAVYGFVDVLVKVDEACLREMPEAGAGLSAVGGQATGSGCGVQELGEPPTETAAAAASPAGPARETVNASPEVGGDDPAGTGAATAPPADATIARIARMVRLEIVEPARALPLLSPHDYRVVEAYVQCYRLPGAARDPRRPANGGSGRWWERLLRRAEQVGQRFVIDEEDALVTEIITADRWQRYEDEALVAEGINSLGVIPLVHIQNTSVPFEYAGASDVEGLIPLQDELNTRLSDRANRIALQSFKMYLGKGIDGFGDRPVSPGRMWSTENEKAGIVEFGGEADSPGETQHIADLREAMDKTSGVSPIAAGAIKDRIGRLTSAAALRVTLISLLARTEKKRTTYGVGLQRMVELSLAWLDRAGVFRTGEAERRVELHWPSPLPENELEKLQEGEMKARLGVPREVVLRELGY